MKEKIVYLSRIGGGKKQKYGHRLYVARCPKCQLRRTFVDENPESLERPELKCFQCGSNCR